MQQRYFVFIAQDGTQGLAMLGKGPTLEPRGDFSDKLGSGGGGWVETVAVGQHWPIPASPSHQ